MTGTARYASCNTHLGIGKLEDVRSPFFSFSFVLFSFFFSPLFHDISTLTPHLVTSSEQSRRDDLESLGYVLLYFLRGRYIVSFHFFPLYKLNLEEPCPKPIIIFFVLILRDSDAGSSWYDFFFLMLSHIISLMAKFLCIAFHGRVWRLPLRSKSMTK